MTEQKFDSKYNNLIVAVAKDFLGEDQNNPPIFQDYKYLPEDITHNIDYINHRIGESNLLKNVLNGNNTYENETNNLSPFNDKIHLLNDYNSRLLLLVNDLNGFNLGCNDNINTKISFWMKYGKNNTMPSLKEMRTKSFRNSCDHLKTRAKRADIFLDNLTQLYGSIESSLKNIK